MGQDVVPVAAVGREHLSQILADHRRELGALLEHWAARQEQSVLRALGFSAPVSSTPPSALALPIFGTPPLPSFQPSGLSEDKHNTSDLLTQSGPSTRSAWSQAAERQFGVSESGAKRALTAVKANALHHTDAQSEDRARVRRLCDVGAQRAEHDVEVTVESLCPQLAILERIVTHVASESVVCFMVLTNVAVIGLRVDSQALRMSHRPEHLGKLWERVEAVYIGFYMLELLTRLLVFRVRFFCGKDRSWNLFDLFVVASAVPELIAYTGDDSRGHTNFSYLRLWRVLKLVKVVRVVRISRAFRELRLVLSSVLGSVKALLWSMILVAGTTYALSIAFVQGTTDLLALKGHGSSSITHEAELIEEIPAYLYFSSLLSGMQSLFASATGGMDWLPLSDALWEVGPGFYMMFFAYISFFTFVIMNTVTSLFLDCVMQHMDKDLTSQVKDMLDKKVRFMEQLRSLHQRMCGDDGAAGATLDKFLEHMDDPEMIYFAHTLQVDVVDLEVVLDILSHGGLMTVDLESFVVGCIRLRGSAKSVDLLSMSIDQKKLALMCEQKFVHVEAQLSAVGSVCSYLAQLLPASGASLAPSCGDTPAKPSEEGLCAAAHCHIAPFGAPSPALPNASYFLVVP